METGSVSFHRFPSDPVESAKWVRHIHRDNFTATDHTRICSKHFASSDYVDHRTDINSSRNRGALKRRRLKLGVYPTIFPTLPAYLSSSSNAQRSTNSSASSRMDIENQRIQIAINELVASDKVLSMTELNDNKFNTCNLTP